MALIRISDVRLIGRATGRRRCRALQRPGSATSVRRAENCLPICSQKVRATPGTRNGRAMAATATTPRSWATISGTTTSCTDTHLFRQRKTPAAIWSQALIMFMVLAGAGGGFPLQAAEPALFLFCCARGASLPLRGRWPSVARSDEVVPLHAAERAAFAGAVSQPWLNLPFPSRDAVHPARKLACF